jgi:ankyrin repeat protein
MKLHDGVASTTTAVWAMLTAAKNGDLERIRELATDCPALLYCQYDYTTPMQFAVREGRAEVVRYLVENGALDLEDRNHPFLQPLLMLAEDRGSYEIAEYLRSSLVDPGLVHSRGDAGKIDHGSDDKQILFQRLVDQGQCDEVEAMLKERPDLALDELAFWGEGILAVPANGADRKMLELLMSFGARVPDLSKWGARYYFKHYEIGKFLLENGMNPNHMNWREFTLLHDMGFTGDVEKARLLLDHGADIDPIDEEYQSTPLAYAAHWGHRELVKLLLERGADPNKAGAEWATPLAWAKRKGKREIASDLKQAGAH